MQDKAQMIQITLTPKGFSRLYPNMEKVLDRIIEQKAHPVFLTMPP
jgi:hypothetical protein